MVSDRLIKSISGTRCIPTTAMMMIMMTPTMMVMMVTLILNKYSQPSTHP